MIKKTLAIVLASLFLVTGAMAAGSSIGFIDLQKVLKDYKETAKTQKEMEKKQKDYQSDMENYQEKLTDAEKAGKSKTELEKMKKDMEDKLTAKQKEILTLSQGFNNQLQARVLTASGSVAKKLGLDLIVDKQAVITGGVDVTEMVITEINK